MAVVLDGVVDGIPFAASTPPTFDEPRLGFLARYAQVPGKPWVPDIENLGARKILT